VRTRNKPRRAGQQEGILDQVLDPSFRLWDAYGMLPVRGGAARARGGHGAAVFGRRRPPAA
jgi:hypothetical protein